LHRTGARFRFPRRGPGFMLSRTVGAAALRPAPASEALSVGLHKQPSGESHRMRNGRLLAALSLSWITVVAGCTAWSRFAGVPQNPIPERERFQLWRDGSAVVVHGLAASEDSLSGVPAWRPPSCDSCRVALARDDVDSIRVRKYSAVRTWILVGSVLGIGVLLGAANPGST
jgi:hypothetical protein